MLDFTGTQIWGVWNARALAGAPPLSQAQMATVADVVYARCDALDGVRDGLIEDPRRCDFDPARHLPQCAGGAPGERCFAPAQIEALGKIYGGVVSRGEVIFPGLPVGAERRGWEGWLIAAEGPSAQLLFGETFLKYLAFEEDDPDYDWRTFDFDADPERMQAIRTLLDATDPDLAGFAGRGGRMITYFGWADPALNPLMAVDYYEAVRATMGADETSDVYRLFMVPGMLHCRGGHGVDRIDGMSALIDWVENGVAPDRLIGARVVDDRVVRTRPLCPYPQVATYRGSGSIDEAGSFACADPEP